MKYLNKSFSVPSAGIYMTDGWWNREPGRKSKGEWIRLSDGRQRWYPKGKEIPQQMSLGDLSVD